MVERLTAATRTAMGAFFCDSCKQDTDFIPIHMAGCDYGFMVTSMVTTAQTGPPHSSHNCNMPDTGEGREITSRANAKEAQTIQQSKKLLSKTKQLFATAEANKLRQRASAKPPPLSTRADVRRAVRNVRRKSM